MSQIRAAFIESLGDLPNLRTVSAPKAGPGEVLVRMRAVALNFADLLKAEGKYQERGVLPFLVGLEGAGEIIEADPATGLTPGTRVAVLMPGTMAEVLAVPATACVPIPDAMSFDDAAGFQIAYGTSHLALTGPGALQSGERLVVLGAAGGVGLTAVQVGRAMGADVVAVARGADKMQFLRDQGAGTVIDSDDCPDLRVALRDLGGVDVVYDPVGDAPGLAAFGALRPDGRYLVIGFAGGKPPQLPLNHALVKNIAIHGFYWGGWRKRHPQQTIASLRAAMEMCAAGKLRPHTGEILPLERLSEGYEMLKNRKALGKIIVRL